VALNEGATRHHGEKSDDPRTPVGVIEKSGWAARTECRIRLINPLPDPGACIKPDWITALEDHPLNLRGELRDKFSLTGGKGYTSRFAHQIASVSAARSNHPIAPDARHGLIILCDLPPVQAPGSPPQALTVLRSQSGNAARFSFDIHKFASMNRTFIGLLRGRSARIDAHKLAPKHDALEQKRELGKFSWTFSQMCTVT
jgi:hypothetical protein